MSGDFLHGAAAPLRAPAFRAQGAGAQGGTASPGGPEDAARKMRKKAEEFEAVFLNTLLGPVFARASEEGDGSSNAGGPWTGLLVEEYSKVISQGGGIGIADAIARQLLAIEEAAFAPLKVEGDGNGASPERRVQ